MGVLTKPLAGTRTEARLGDLVDGMELWGPDLRALPTLAAQLDRLDAAVVDPDTYALAWIDIQAVLASRDGTFGATLLWLNDDADDAEPRLYLGGVACDDQEPERLLRCNAIADHMPEDPAYRRAIIDQLRLRGHYTDNRAVRLRDLFATVRRYLANRGELLISPKGRIEMGGGWPARREDDRSAEQLAEAEAATRAMARVIRRHRSHARLIRLVARLGAAESGWLVLGHKQGRAA